MSTAFLLVGRSFDGLSKALRRLRASWITPICWAIKRGVTTWAAEVVNVENSVGGLSPWSYDGVGILATACLSGYVAYRVYIFPCKGENIDRVDCSFTEIPSGKSSKP